MNAKLNRMMKDESGITALETAIILIAFVVVAAIFAFTVLSTGTFLTEKSKEAAYAGLEEVRGSMKLQGSLVLESTAPAVATTRGDVIVFNLANVAGGASVDLSKVTMFYRDSLVNTPLTFQTTNCVADAQPGSTASWCIDDSTITAGTSILKSGGIVKVRVRVATGITANKTFAIEIKPPTGGTMLIERTAPAMINTVTDLK
jgi:archaeal flagellin FlaB